MVKQKSAGINPDLVDAEKFREWWSILYQSIPLDDLESWNTDAANVREYLKWRGIKYVPKSLLVWPANKDHPTCMVLPVIDLITNLLIGCHITHIKGHKKPFRQTLGHIGGGVAVLSDLGKGGPLLVGEGIEEGMTGHQLTRCPAVSALNATNMGSVGIPSNHHQIIILSNNDKAGLLGSGKLSNILASDGAGRLVRVATRAKEGRDWNDAIRHGPITRKRKNGLIRRIMRTSRIVEATKHAKLVTYTTDELITMKLIPRINLLDPWLPVGGICMIHAEKGVGKTLSGLGIAFAIVYGRSFLGWTPRKRGNVLIVDGEMPQNQMQERVGQFKKRFVKEGETSEYSIKLVSLTGQKGGSMPDLTTLEGQARIDAVVDKETVLIIIDPISRLCRTGEENATESWRIVADWALQHRASGRTVLFMHHSGKSGTQRGASSREDDMDTVIKLKHPVGWTAADGCVFELTYEKSRGGFGPEVAPFKAKLFVDEDGRFCEDLSDIMGSTENKIVAFLRENPDASQREIAEVVGITKGRVSQIMKEGRRHGLFKDRKRTFRYRPGHGKV